MLANLLATGALPIGRPEAALADAVKLLGGLVKLLLVIAIGTGVLPEIDVPDTLVGGLLEVIDEARVSALPDEGVALYPAAGEEKSEEAAPPELGELDVSE